MSVDEILIAVDDFLMTSIVGPEAQRKMDRDRSGKVVKSRGRSIISELLEAQIEVYLAI